MGNFGSSDDGQILREKLTFIESLNFPGGQIVQIFRRGDKECYAMSSPLSPQFLQRYKNPKSIENRIKLQHSHIMKALGIDRGQNMVQNNENRFFFEYSYITLDSLIEERLGSSKFFPESDLQALLQGICSALAFQQQNKITNGSISPSSIYFDQEAGTFKIYDSEILQGRASNYMRVLQYQQFLFLCPDMIQAIRQNSSFISDELIYSNDIFSLGMTLLEAASLSKSEECYDQNSSILDKVIQNRLNYIQNYYSLEFVNILRIMLKYGMKERPDCIKLWTLLNSDKQQQQQYIQNQTMLHDQQQYIQTAQQQYQQPIGQVPQQWHDNSQWQYYQDTEYNPYENLQQDQILCQQLPQTITSAHKTKSPPKGILKSPQRKSQQLGEQEQQFSSMKKNPQQQQQPHPTHQPFPQQVQYVNEYGQPIQIVNLQQQQTENPDINEYEQKQKYVQQGQQIIYPSQIQYQHQQQQQQQPKGISQVQNQQFLLHQMQNQSHQGQQIRIVSQPKPIMNQQDYILANQFEQKMNLQDTQETQLYRQVQNQSQTQTPTVQQYKQNNQNNVFIHPQQQINAQQQQQLMNNKSYQKYDSSSIKNSTQPSPDQNQNNQQTVTQSQNISQFNSNVQNQNRQNLSYSPSTTQQYQSQLNQGQQNFSRNQNEFISNIQQIKEEIQKSKQMIEQYQTGYSNQQQQYNKSNQNSQTHTPQRLNKTQEINLFDINQQQAREYAHQQTTQDRNQDQNSQENLQDRLLQVLQKSQAIREKMH